MKREILEVTAEDIAAAKECRLEEGLSGSNCPIALAVTRQDAFHRQAWARGHEIAHATRGAVPSQRMLRFMRQWDWYWRAQPTRFLVVWEG